ncbi:glycosyltransferase [Corynebacterium poyangense]|uniref:Glycosyltransferase n=1 Tax=Corynebacterium poyangense TaxID=2684405 RepID=A0A7H0SPV2_9CORY|nr:glycosyltransferase family 4 protein [Corynebacterium poyangense]MBZ8178169.1 glycosyltransferase [Corynebacterium poyangense]QNQ90577.1 glycosyltransferase [Corynebacterium poyangense]
MSQRILLVTNDFPPRIGGIQSYLRDFLFTLNPADICVFASVQDPSAAVKHDAEFPIEVIRWPHKIMLPTPATARRMQEIIREKRIETVWFGAAAPLGLLAPHARAAGARCIIASTHGHEVGWSMLPGARHVLRRIGNSADVVTYISEYTLGRFRPAMGNHPSYRHLPSGVDVELFHPLDTQQRQAVRQEHGFGSDPLVVCVSRLVPRKGQDQLIRVWPRVIQRFPRARLVIIGSGRDGRRLAKLASQSGASEQIHLLGSLDFDHLRALLASADIAAVPVRTRGGGLDVEGLGIVYLEAQASGVPVIAGDSGGAPETVTPESGIVVPGKDQDALYVALTDLLADPQRRRLMGEAGRRHVCQNWTWDVMGQRLQALL